MMIMILNLKNYSENLKANHMIEKVLRLKLLKS